MPLTTKAESFMRFLLRLTTTKDKEECLLPIDYQYMQSAVIYKILCASNEAYASWLHNNGYQLGNGKRFKLFCYSRFQLGRYQLDRETRTLHLTDLSANWTIAFLPELSTTEFIQGLMGNNSFTIGNNKHRVTFRITSVEALQSPPFLNDMTYEATSPVCIKQHSDGKTMHLAPSNVCYGEAIRKGLLSRYEALYGQPFKGDLSGFRFEPEERTVKSSLVNIKGINMRGYRYRFRLIAPVELQKIAYDGGLGEECSQGFGFIEKIGKR